MDTGYISKSRFGQIFLKKIRTSLKLHLDYDREQMEDFDQTEINVS